MKILYLALLLLISQSYAVCSLSCDEKGKRLLNPCRYPEKVHISEKMQFLNKLEDYLKNCDKDCPYYSNGFKDCFEKLKPVLMEAKKKSHDEINILIGNSSEISLVLDKCKEYETTFDETLQVCKSISDSISISKITEGISKITELLKANELEECINECQRNDLRNASSDFSEKISDLCEKQLSDKVKKLPLKKITSPEVAKIYFSPFYESTSFLFEQIPKNSTVQIQGRVLQNEGKKAMLELRDYNFFVKHSGQCFMREGAYLNGYGKYLGEETYTTVMGAKRTLPVFQLLWCPQ